MSCGKWEPVGIGARYFKTLYKRTMDQAYKFSWDEIVNSLRDGGNYLDCGAASGWIYDAVRSRIEKGCYYGVDWNISLAQEMQAKGLRIALADLNSGFPFQSNQFQCVFALSLLEHLMRPCFFLQDCYRVLRPGGSLVLLTPNISTYFTAALILAGRMPSSGPHPDSDELLKRQEMFQVNDGLLTTPRIEDSTPIYRHLIVFSFRVLKQYLRLVGFGQVIGRGFGVYPFPNFTQPLLEKLDPYHCHQMVFVARK